MELPDDKFMTEIGFNNQAGKDRVNMANWLYDAVPGDDEKKLSTYTIRVMYEAASGLQVDFEMFQWFHDFFEDWKIEDFNRLDKTTRTKLKDFLLWRGVYVDHTNRKTIPMALMELLEMEDPLEWPEKALQKRTFHPRSKIASRHHEQTATTYIKESRIVNDTHMVPSIEEEDEGIHKETPSKVPNQVIQDHVQSPLRSVQDISRFTPETGANAIPVMTPSHSQVKISAIPTSSVPLQARSLDPYTKVPPDEYGRQPVDSQLAMKFTKAWDKTKNYSGELYDILDDKVRIFLRLCRLTEIQLSQCWAVFPEMLSGRAETYYMHHVNPDASFAQMYWAIKSYFDTESNHALYYQDWTSITLVDVRRENTGKTLPEAVEILVEKLHLCQRALGPHYMSPEHLVSAIIRACQGSPEMSEVLSEPTTKFETLVSRLRARAAIMQKKEAAGQYLAESNNVPSTHFTDRKYVGKTSRGNRPPPQRSWRRQNRQDNGSRQRRDGRCWICNKPDCRSYNHSEKERSEARERFDRYRHAEGKANASDKTYRAFLMDFEAGYNITSDSEDEEEADDNDEDEATAYFMVGQLQDQAFLHWITGEETEQDNPPTIASQFVIDRHDSEIFHGILPDTGAARVSTVGRRQLTALQKIYPGIMVDESRAGEHSIRFGQGDSVDSEGAVTIKTPIGDVDFHVMNTPTPFLLCIADMDRHEAYLDNTTNCLVKGDLRVPIVRKWGHPWFFLDNNHTPVTFLTEVEMRRLHRRFGHPSVDRLHKLLEQAGHDDVDHKSLAEIERYCHHCQMNRQAPRRFKFTLTDDQEFNFEIVVDVMYLDGEPVLHVVDSATSFQAAKFLKSLSAKDTWEAIRMTWIDTYLGPPDVISHDAGTNFAANEFKVEAMMMGIRCHQMPVEAHSGIGKVERYHAPLRRAFNIISAEMGSTVSKDVVLQMAVKAINDTAGPDGIVPTVLVFGAYPRLTLDSPPSALTIRRAQAMKKAMAELRKAVAERKVNDALNTRNGPIITETLNLPPGADVKVWREGKGWTGPHKLISVNGHDVTVDLGNGAVAFRATSVQQYLRDQRETDDGIHVPEPPVTPPPPRRRGRPRGSKNKQKADVNVYLSKKEKGDLELALKLRREGKIVTEGAPFELSSVAEIDGLIANGTFKIVHRDDVNLRDLRIFNSRLVNEIKGKNEIPYEKSRLVIQGYNDAGKAGILTQAPTIQRASQRLLISLIPTLLSMDMVVEIRDITQAYTQAKTKLQRIIVANLPKEMRGKYPLDSLLLVEGALYGIPEAGVHWFGTYHEHHKVKMDMETSTYDPCLLVTKPGAESFGLVGMQTDDTLIIATEKFARGEERALQEAGFKAKPKTQLSQDTPLEFNGARIILEQDNVFMRQKGQATKIEPVGTTDRAQKYIEQRARGAYLASICQPEASYDLAVAAQLQEKDRSEDDYLALNKRLIWQAENPERGLRFIPLDLTKAKIMIFTDGSFANNRDLTSQIGFLIAMVNEEFSEEGRFIATGNIIHWASSKCKRVTRSVLASEIYGLTTGFDHGITLASTIKMITDRLNLPTIPVVVCTDSYSLYECLVKLGTTKEKRLMIDLMALRQSYEKREIDEIRWIHGDDNPADAFTKANPNGALWDFIDKNKLTIRVEGFVERTKQD
ncbi:conserved hypothetical protein [Talaromyces stipitatus ATCC 10500]|uniref:Integrase catalytic domain-containing protein n=1 Tax=Talaromyces stipitatus (strain ATCC 10500 / CBS 375.48 / QM 6759 / NRRL 1006) TaxID=441959 RepID=B8LU90_TALSN|nr:uncharacterized protein TSTA_060540 [Talaromyces stipitatus ATCC 10500]EED22562.1 conserved hypothetical protein [Talaromyces stipitatus ATCC 10500]